MRYQKPLKERIAEQERKEAIIQGVFDARGKALELARQEKRQKKKDVDDLLRKLDVQDIIPKQIRPSNTYIPRSYNLEKQVIGLVNHMFVRYPVPYFLYQACLPGDENFAFMKEVYRQWFVTLAQGGSFSKLVKGLMTSKEAFVFLNAPSTNHIHENVWWAKMKLAGLPKGVAEKLISKIFTNHFFDDPDGRLAEAINFYAKFHGEMDKQTFDEITDFAAWTLRNNREFRFKGRTVASMVALSNEWHIEIQKADIGKYTEWPGLGIPKWDYIEKAQEWEVVELLSNQAIVNEGRKQKHCVASYVNWCIDGYCSIFSLRCYSHSMTHYDEDGVAVYNRLRELRRVTIEVGNNRTVRQIRGVLNRQPTDEEKLILRLWAGEKGLSIRV